jgi:cysteine synthase
MRVPRTASRELRCREPLMHAPRAGNTGIALAMAASIKGYKMKLIMPSNMSEERRLAMSAYGAQFGLGAAPLSLAPARPARATHAERSQPLRWRAFSQALRVRRHMRRR